MSPFSSKHGTVISLLVEIVQSFTKLQGGRNSLRTSHHGWLAASVGEDCMAFASSKSAEEVLYADWLKDGKEMSWWPCVAGQDAVRDI